MGELWGAECEPLGYAARVNLRKFNNHATGAGTPVNPVTPESVMESIDIFAGEPDRAVGTGPKPDSSTALFQAESFGLLYREHYGAIAGLIYRRTGNKHATEDLTNDVFVAAFRSLQTYRAQVPILVWLRRIAHNRVNRWVRREAGLRGLLRRIPIFREVLLAPGFEGERAPALAALLRLPASQQEVLSSHYLEGMSLEEIGAMLGVSDQAVKSRLARARESLRRELERDGQLGRGTETETRR